MIIGVFVYGIFFTLILLAVVNRILIYKSRRNQNLLKVKMIVEKINKYIGWFILAFIFAALIALLNTLSRYGMI